MVDDAMTLDEMPGLVAEVEATQLARRLASSSLSNATLRTLGWDGEFLRDTVLAVRRFLGQDIDVEVLAPAAREALRLRGASVV